MVCHEAGQTFPCRMEWGAPMKRILIGFMVSLCLLLGGCSWKDASDLSAVTAGAITRENGQYVLTAELAIPSADSASPDAITG